MKVRHVVVSHSFKGKTSPGVRDNFDMSEYSCSRMIDVDDDENPTDVIKLGLMACRKSVIDACRTSNLQYTTGAGPEGKDLSCTVKGYVPIGQENAFMSEILPRLHVETQKAEKDSKDEKPPAPST